MSDYLIAGEDVEDYDPYAPTEEEEVQMEADLVEEMPQIEALPDEEDLNTVSAAELERARSAIRDSQVSADRLMNASRTLDSLVFGVTRDEDSSISATEFEIIDAKSKLELHRLSGAKRSIKRAERNLKNLEKDIKELRKNIALLNRLIKDKTIQEAEIETLLRGLQSATGAAEGGEVAQAAFEVEHLIDGLVEHERSSLNPFLFRKFWMGIDTRWPAGSDGGVLMIRLVNDGDRPIPEMRLEPPVPRGWVAEPKSIDLPAIRPGGFLPIRFNITPEERFARDSMPLYRKLSIQTGYEMNHGDVTCVVRVHNRTMDNLNDILVVPWMPPGFNTASVPVIRRLAADEVGVIRMPLYIEMGEGGDF